MNRTTVKRGIGAVILALIAAALLAFLLKDKAAQRQDVVDMALPGADGGVETSDNSTTRLPQLSTDNSGNGTIVAQAGQENTQTSVAEAASNAAQVVTQEGATLIENTTDASGKIIASAAAVGSSAAEAVATTGDAAKKSIDFNVRANQQASTDNKASDEFRELDLVNNGAATAPKPTATEDSNASSASQGTQQSANAKQEATEKKPDQGTVIASTTPRKAAKSNNVQARLIGEKKTAAPKSSRTATVITKKAPAPKQTAPQAAPAPEKAAPVVTTEAKNGYAIQLLATSSASRANDLKKVMAGEGYPTYITKTQQNGKVLYRVRIGQYTTRAAASKTQAAMKRRYKKNTYVNGSAIVAR